MVHLSLDIQIYVEKTVVVPEKHKHIESMLLFIYKDDSVKNE